MASVSVTVESIAAGGDGVARAEGFVVFVPRSAPGDVGVVDIAMRGSFARAEFVRLEKPAPSRVEPACPHYTTDKCGGCQLQHMEYDAQLEAKSGIIRDTMVRIGKRAIERPEVEPSPQQWRYRRKLTLAMQRSGARWIAGSASIRLASKGVRAERLSDHGRARRRDLATDHGGAVDSCRSRRRCAAPCESTRAARRSCSRAGMCGPRPRDSSSPWRRSRRSGGSPRRSAAG